MTNPQVRAEELLKALNDHPTLSDALRGEAQDWFSAVWTRVAVALGDEPIEYLDGLVEGEWAAYTLNLIIYTPTRLVRATGSGADENPELKVWTVGRHHLDEVVFEGGAQIGLRGDQLNWPRVRCVAEYPKETLQLPQPRTDRTQMNRLAEFLPSLLRDLDRS